MTRTLHFAALFLLAAGLLSGAPVGDDSLRGDHVGWARLKTPSPWWNRHADSDRTLTLFLRGNTTLNIDPKWYAADAENLTQMCNYPLLFSQGIDMLQTVSSRTNVAEYVRRGGFLLVDACCNEQVTSDVDVFLRDHTALLAQILPEARIVPLPESHVIYRCYFQIPNRRPPHTFFNNIFNTSKAKHGLYGIMIGPRMAGLVSLSGLQCGWARVPAPPDHELACMKMAVNIYVHAMLQGAEK